MALYLGFSWYVFIKFFKSKQYKVNQNLFYNTFVRQKLIIKQLVDLKEKFFGFESSIFLN